MIDQSECDCFVWNDLAKDCRSHTHLRASWYGEALLQETKDPHPKGTPFGHQGQRSVKPIWTKPRLHTMGRGKPILENMHPGWGQSIG